MSDRSSDLFGPSSADHPLRPAHRAQGWEGRDHVLLAAIEAAPVPMTLSDPNRPDDPLVFVNPAFLRLTGYGRSEVLGRNCRFLQGPESDPDAVDRIRRGIRARDEVAVELLNYRKDGTRFWNALFISPVFDDGGALAYLFASQLDVTERRESGAPRPVADVAHDLNNMLQVIAGQMEGLERHMAASGDPRLIRRMRAVSEAAGRAIGLTRQLLGASSTSEGRTSPVDVDASVSAAARTSPARRAERVLVVDDHAEVAQLARTMLEDAGFSVEIAGSGQDALEKLQAGFTLLFSDLVMPGSLDGLSLAREARRRDPRLKVLLTTGRAGSAVPVDPDGSGFETIAKPYRRADLVRAVRRLLDVPVDGG